MHTLCSYMPMHDGPVPLMPISGHTRSAQPMIFSMSCPCCQPRRYHYNFLPLPPFTMTTGTGITLAAPFMFCNDLQAGKSRDKWSDRSRVAIYLGRSPTHSQTVALCLSLTTGLVSPQFHFKVDPMFQTLRPAF